MTAGHVSDIRTAELLTKEATRFRRLVADKSYDANRFREALRDAGMTPIIPGRSNRKRRIHHNERRYRDRWLIGAKFCRVKDFRRVATRCDKLAANFLSAAALAAVAAFWL